MSNEQNTAVLATISFWQQFHSGNYFILATILFWEQFHKVCLNAQFWPQRYEEFHSGTVRYGIFAKSRYTGIFRYGISLIFYPRIFRELFDSFCFFFIAAIGDQFRELLGLLHIHKLPKVRHHNKHYHQWGKVKQMQPMWLCILKGRPFEETYEIAQWRQVKQMQPMWLCFFSGRPFEDTFENAQWGKLKQMQPM